MKVKKIVKNAALVLLSIGSHYVVCKDSVDSIPDKDAHKHLSDQAIKKAQTGLDNTGKEPNDDGFFLIDTMKAVVYGQQRTDIITLSDIARPSIDGNKQSLEDLILAKLICQDAARYKMEPDDEAVDKHLKAVQRENNLSLDELQSIFRSAGYTYEEGREQFRNMTAIGTMVDFRIRSRLIVPEKDIQTYYQDHPIVQEASYQIERALVVCPDGMDQAIFMQELQKLIDTGSCKLDIDWADPFWINKSELAQDKQFLTTMEVGAIAMGTHSAAGIELFKLINSKEERLKSLEERYNEIAEILKRPKYNELFEAYKKDLFTSAAVIYF